MVGKMLCFRAASAVLLTGTLLACRGKAGLPPSDGYDPASTFVPGAQTPGQIGNAAACGDVKAEGLRARRAVTGADTSGTTSQPTSITVTRARLWNDFRNTCGQAACHGARSGENGNPLARSPDRFTVSEQSFHQRTDIGTASVARILTSNADLVMPPGSGDGTLRRADDPVRLLGEQLLAWEEAGFPDTFQVQNKDPGAGPDPSLPQAPYQVSVGLADKLTNLGSCLPIAEKLEVRMDAATSLDAVFAQAKSFDDLPDTLLETDLVSLDSQVLAQTGVFSYAPTYTLFSDHASKMRYVRVPVGQKIKYNEKIKDFDIPPNTRFYKTFLRKVIDKNGEVGYRKMETRLIVSRPDEKLANGSYRVGALMAIYAWDKDEMMARKVTDPLRSLQPWADRLCPYVTDEREPRTQASNPVSPDMNLGTCKYMAEEELADLSSGKIRHYALPSQERCVQCHMGSGNHSFILGFTPWHVDRRRAGEGGVFEDPHEDELDQLQRLIDYGVIEGLAPGQAKLEESQGDRKPRNDHELTAQGYMMGNCAFCHNPNGFPTVENPVLKDFDLYPSQAGGIFQFPLEKYSPRAKVGPRQDLRFPYITPAFGDYVKGDGGTTDSARLKGHFVESNDKSPTNDWLPFTTFGGANFNHPDQNVNEFDPSRGFFTFVAPWRSLIWRNVYTPFTYEEDNTIFIHMPRNVPGFDCRAQAIMAKWMLSIPSIPKLGKEAVREPATGEVLIPGNNPYSEEQNDGLGSAGFEQPYQEVKPGQYPYAMLKPGEAVINQALVPYRKFATYTYEDAVLEGQARAAMYAGSLSGQHCPQDEDIVDAHVVNSPEATAPSDHGVLRGPRVNPDVAGELHDEVPDHAHWVPIDTTDPPGRWVPRRTQWKEMLVDRDPSVATSPQLKQVIDELNGLYLTREREIFSNQRLPMGIWHRECLESVEASSSKTVDQLSAEEQNAGPKDLHRWLLDRDRTGSLMFRTQAQREQRVHSQSRGEAVFRAICLNCHGKDVDSKSPLAATIVELTGGETRVANFKDGIYGPVTAPGQYAEGEFYRAGRGGTPQDWQARYMVFMGMGGTESLIPSIALKLVSTSPFYGFAPSTGDSINDANMLESARSLCRNVLRQNWAVEHFSLVPEMLVSIEKSLIGTLDFVPGSGHYELWAGICGFQNKPLVRVFSRVVPKVQGLKYRMFEFAGGSPVVLRAKDSQGAWVYPPAHPVGTLAGKVERGIQPHNHLPWCVLPPNEASREESIEHFRTNGIERIEDMPFCPASLLTEAFGRRIHQLLPEPFDQEMIDGWTRTGAINAGVAAYYYLDGVSKGTIKPQSAFDECKRQ